MLNFQKIVLANVVRCIMRPSFRTNWRIRCSIGERIHDKAYVIRALKENNFECIHTSFKEG